MKILRKYPQIMSVHICTHILHYAWIKPCPQRGTDRQTAGRRDGQAESNILSPKLRFRGGGGGKRFGNEGKKKKHF